MLRGMIFLDHMNFDIALKDYYRSLGSTAPKLDYNKLFKNTVLLKENVDFTKAHVFAPCPDSFLMQDEHLYKYYKWVKGLNNAKYTDVIEGRYVARPTRNRESMIITDQSTYYKVEKGTDLNLAICALTNGFYNSYDVAFVMSADTDYISLYHQLKNIGKIVIVVAIKGQNIRKIIPEVDDYILIDDDFFQKCLRESCEI